ncbi:MAG: glycosyltransferase family 2 protein [Bacteroidota bacterium]
MLSILIPVYNVEIVTLVEDLRKQCLQTGLLFEILCFDDGSAPEYLQSNQQIRQFPFVQYRKMDTNLGRSRIRNALADAATFDYLLFMDADSAVVRDNYIQQYYQHIHPERVLVGTTTYQPKPPQNPTVHLRWHYGQRRERLSAAQRSKHPYHAFRTHHFLIPKTLFQSIRFDETLLEYGHEDTIFGLELKRRKVPILHIDNPLEHTGLEPTQIFLSKSRRALSNLYRLDRKGAPIDTRLLRLFKRLKSYHLGTIVLLIFGWIEPLILKNLHSRFPSLWLFDYYKLAYLIRESRQTGRHIPMKSA